MATHFKICYIGAGSHRFSMGLFRNIVAAAKTGLRGKPIHAALVDPRPHGKEGQG
jgi:alpha-galactosidase/6-phospho-beta-glucosidase family protein